MQHSKIGNFYTFVISSNHSFISQVLKVVGPLVEKLDFSVPWDLIFRETLILKPQKSSFTQSALQNDMQTRRIWLMIDKQSLVNIIQSAENRRKVSPILVTLTSRSDSDFERSNVSLKENKPDGVNPNCNDKSTNTFERMKEKFYGFRQTEFPKPL